MSENTGFFAKIMERRIPQFLGIFLAGSWTTLEFTQWAVGRYSLSPNWEEVLVVCLLLCLPMILVLAWHHGAPGKQKWTLFEKAFLPLYLLFIPLALHHLYKDVELGKTVETVMVEASSGEMQARKVAKSEYIKPLIIYPLKNTSGDEKLELLAAISSEVLNRDLKQNIFFSTQDIEIFKNGLKNRNQSYKNIPLSFQINFAKQRNRDYLVNGTLDNSDQGYALTIDLYSSKNGRKLTSFTAVDKNYFSAIDSISQKINDNFFPNGAEFTDLPIEDLYTSNWQAFEDYIKARMLDWFGENRQEAEAYFISAIEKDSTFSMASFAYAIFSIQHNNKINKARELATKAQQHQDYRFTERERFPINATVAFLSQQSEKGFQALEQWSLLHPTDSQAYLMKAQFSQFNKGGPKVAIENFKKVIELDPSQHALWDQIGDIYNAIGEYDNALNAYEQYAQQNSSNPIAYKNLGDLYVKTSKFDAVISNYQKALALKPNDPNVLRTLADAYGRLGNFEQAEQTYLLAIQYSNTPERIFSYKQMLSQFYWRYGKRQGSVKYLKEAFKEFKQSISTTKGLQQEALFAWQYYLAGEKELAQEIVEQSVALAKETNEDILLINSEIGKGMMLNYAGKSQQALEVYDELLRIGGAYSVANTPVINHFKGRSLFFSQQYDLALEALLPIQQKFPDRLDFIEWPAKTYLAKGELENAEKNYQRLLELAPAYPAYNLGMAKILIAGNQLIKAKEHLVKALDAWQHADMEFDDITEAKNLLASL